MAIILNKDNSKGKEEINEEDIKKLAGNLDVIFAKTSAKKLGEINKLFIQIGEKLLSKSIKKHQLNENPEEKNSKCCDCFH